MGCLGPSRYAAWYTVHRCGRPNLLRLRIVPERGLGLAQHVHHEVVLLVGLEQRMVGNMSCKLLIWLGIDSLRLGDQMSSSP